MGRSFWLALLVNLSLCAAEQVCRSTSGCRCEMDDGDVIIDLTNLLPNDKFLTATKNRLTYYFHGCIDAKFVSEVVNNETQDECNNKLLTACFYDDHSNVYKLVGNASTGVFTKDKENDNLRQITYQVNKITTLITLVCTPEMKETELEIHQIDDAQHHLHLFSPSACKVQVDHHLSTGSKLVIMFFVFTLTYLVGGGCIAYFLQGARGREVVPHVEFWMGLPGLVKDGFVFLMNGCNPSMVATAETYDQI